MTQGKKEIEGRIPDRLKDGLARLESHCPSVMRIHNAPLHFAHGVKFAPA
jgi:hypothetical protein